MVAAEVVRKRETVILTFPSNPSLAFFFCKPVLILKGVQNYISMLQTCMFVSVMLRMEEEGLECWVEKEISNANP